MYGPNLFTVDQDEWKRHKRVSAPAVNERIMGAVWEVSSTQAREMMAEIEKPRAAETNTTFDSMKTISINVIGSVSFGSRTSFTDANLSEIPAGFNTTFMTSVLSFVNNMFLSVFIPSTWLKLPFMPKSVRDIGIAKEEFPLHIK